MLAFTSFPSTSSSDLFAFDVIAPRKMLFCSDFTSSDDVHPADDSGFFDDSTHPSTNIGYTIGRRLAELCDDFDAELMSFRRPPPPTNLFARILEFFHY